MTAEPGRCSRFRWIALATWLPALAVVWIGCSTDIDLGGAPDAASNDAPTDVRLDAAPEASGGNADCEPCDETEDCHAGATCAQLTDAGDTYCATLCPNGLGCGASQTCRVEPTLDGLTASACAPTAGSCAPASPPAEKDGAPLDRCGALNGPTVPSQCRSCHYDCQPNGCYGGWWCDTATRQCVRPPKSCP